MSGWAAMTSRMTFNMMFGGVTWSGWQRNASAVTTTPCKSSMWFSRAAKRVISVAAISAAAPAQHR
jgi:hypothetical protein